MLGGALVARGGAFGSSSNARHVTRTSSRRVEALERGLEAALADVAPGAGDVGPDLDVHPESNLEQRGREPGQGGRDQHPGEHRLVVAALDAGENRAAGEVADDHRGHERGERGGVGEPVVAADGQGGEASSEKPMNVTVSVSRVSTGVAPRTSM